MPYNTEGKSQKMARAYGTHMIHSGNGKLVAHEATVAPGGGVQVKARLALGESKFHAIEKLYYDAFEIAPAYYQFHKESGAVSPSSTMFPTMQLLPGSSFLDYQLPVGMSNDNQPDKAIARAKCLEISDYDASGNEIDFGFSDNAGRVLADGVKHIHGDLSILDFGAWAEYKAWTAENITVIIDGVNQQLARFPLNIWLQPTYDLGIFLERVCQLSCSDYTYANGKIRMIPGKPKTPVMAFNGSNVTSAFLFQPTEEDARYNGVRVIWRNLFHPFLIEEDPIIVERRSNPNTEDERFIEINAGVCRRDVGERIGNYVARVAIDMADFAMIRASRKAYVTLPGDVVTLSHPKANWTNVRCRVIKKIEKEDRETLKGIEKFEGYPIVLRREPVDPYSDTDKSPIVTRTAVVGPNPYSAPPAATFTLQQRTTVQNDKTSIQSVFGTITFGSFAFDQYAKVLWMRPGGVYEEIRIVRPDANGKATFDKSNLAAGTHYFKVVTYSNRHVPQISVGGDTPFTILARDFFVGEFNAQVGLGRAFDAFDPNSTYVRDTEPVPRSRITGRVVEGTAVDNNLNVKIEVSGEVIGAKTDLAAQGESIFKSYLEVYSKYGELRESFTEGFNGIGTLGKGVYRREDADPFEEAVLKMIIQNKRGFSLPKYIYNGSTLSDNPPPWKNKADCPQNAVGTPLTSSSVSFSASFNFSGGKTLKLQKREVGQRFADWTDHLTGIPSLPITAIGFPADKELEFRLVSSSGTNNASKIMRVKTFQVGQQAPARPVPTALSVVPNPAAPTSSLHVTFNTNTGDNTGIDLEINGTVYSFGALYMEHFINSLGEGVARTVRVRNTWSSGVPTSAWTDYVTGSTQVTPPPSTPPQNFQGIYDNANQETDFTFTPGTGSGAYTLEISGDGSNWTNTGLSIGAGANSFSYVLAKTTAQYTRYFRLKRNDVAGYAPQIVQVIVPAQDTQGNIQPTIDSAYTMPTGQYYSMVSGSFTPHGGTGDFQIFYDEIGGGSKINGQWIAESSGVFTFNFEVGRNFNNYDIRVYCLRDNVTGEPEKYQVTIEGHFGN